MNIFGSYKSKFKQVSGERALKLKASILCRTPNGVVFCAPAYDKTDFFMSVKNGEATKIDRTDFLALAGCPTKRYAGFSKQEFEHKGGMIVFSTTINATASDSFIGKLWAKVQTFLNDVTKNKRIRDVVDETAKEKNIDFGVSIGKNFLGRYVNPNTKEVYDEKSFTITVLGVSSELLFSLMEKLILEFHQQAVVYHDYNTGKEGLYFYTED